MTRLTVELPDEVAQCVAGAAAERGVAPEALASQVVADRFPPRRRPSFIGIGRSGHSDTAQRHKEIIREAFGNKTARDV